MEGDGADPRFLLYQLASALFQNQQQQGAQQHGPPNPLVPPLHNLHQDPGMFSTFSDFVGGNQNVLIHRPAPILTSNPAAQVPSRGPSDHGSLEYRPLSRGERQNLTAQERKERIRIKNRLAQQRFRDRRKAQKMATLDRYNKICAELDELYAENDALADREEVLTKLYYTRCTLLQVLLAGGKARPPQDKQAPAGGSVAVDPSGSNTHAISHKGVITAAGEPTNDTTVTNNGTSVAAAGGAVLQNKASGGVTDEAEGEAGATSVKDEDQTMEDTAVEPSVQIQPHVKVKTEANGSDTSEAPAAAQQNFSTIEVAEAPVANKKTQKAVNLMSFPEWLTDIRVLMEKAAQLGFPAETVAELETAVRQQHEAWSQVASNSKMGYAQLMSHLLAPADAEVAGSGLVGRDTLETVAAGLTPSALEELRQLQASYEMLIRRVSIALTEWKADLLPLLRLSCEGLNVGPWNGMASRHHMVGSGAAQLERLEEDIWSAVATVGTSWSRIIGPLSSALCHLEAAPFHPNVMLLIKAVIEVAQEQQQGAAAAPL